MAMEEEKLEAQMEFARYEHETELLRERKFRFLVLLINLIKPQRHACENYFMITKCQILLN